MTVAPAGSSVWHGHGVTQKNRNAPILFAVLLLTGCATTPPPTAYEVWQSRLTEGQTLTMQAAVLAAEVFNEICDHTGKELADPDRMATLRDKINEARRLYRRAQSWGLSKMPSPPDQPTDQPACSFPNHWVLLSPGLGQDCASAGESTPSKSLRSVASPS